MARPPRIQIPGTNRGVGIPPGYLAGRPPGSGHGPLQLISIQQLQRFGIKSSKTGATSLGNQAGFQFSIPGVVPANTLVGVASWSKDLTFHNGDANNNWTDISNPISAYAFRMLDSLNNLVGNLNVTTAGVGTVVWVADPEAWPAGKQMQFWTQVAADGGLAGVNGRVVGYF